MHIFIYLFLSFLTFGCSKGSAPGAQGPAGIPPLEQRGSIPYLDALLPPDEADLLGEKYRPIFTNEKILKAISYDLLKFFPDWDSASQKEFLETIAFLEKNHGAEMPPFEGSANPYFQMADLRVSIMQFVPEFANYLQRTHIAWNLYLEANQLVPWSILNYSSENLKILFHTSLQQPKLGNQHFTADIDPTENYKIVRGMLREPGDAAQDLVGDTALETVLNAVSFLGEHVTHFIGSARNDMGPRSAIWPYRTRDDQGNILNDAQGNPVPLNRLPTPKDILIFRDPHHDLAQHPEGVLGPQYHIVNGCWGASKLLQSLLGSVNLPVALVGDYVNFGGHSGVKFAEVEGHEYFLNHADDMYHFAWAYGLLKPKEILNGNELWGVAGFTPFKEAIPGYSILHTDHPPFTADHASILNALKIEGDKIDLFNRELGNDFGGYEGFDLRVLALRAMSHPSAQNLYTRCLEPGLERRHLPLDFLTGPEEAAFIQTLDFQIVIRRVLHLGQPATCIDLFSNELNDLYKKKTGLDLKGDEDKDGFENYRDCRVYSPDNAPCEDAIKQALGIITMG